MIRAIVCDIEGTTTSLSFVKDVLFPYARQHIRDFIYEQAQQAEITRLLKDVREEMQQADASLEQVADQLVSWIDQDRKITPLKAIQGHIWQYGYQNGDYHGHIYPDAYQKLKDWHESGIGLYIFSSGSVYAQKLLFSHTEHGDLTPLFSGYFDTNIGAKTETASYRAIAQQIQVPSEEILFLSDIDKELDAARDAGMATICLVREGPLDPHSSHRQVNSFSDITV